MTFSYDPTTPVGAVRFYLHDVVENDGPFPGKRNFSNEEIQLLLDRPGTALNDALVSCLDTLSTAWAPYAVSESDQNLSFDGKQPSVYFKDLANERRKNPIDLPSTSGTLQFGVA